MLVLITRIMKPMKTSVTIASIKGGILVGPEIIKACQNNYRVR
jgi:hypothetical protein